MPLVSRLSARGDLRTAAWRSTLAYGVLVAVLTAAFSEAGDVAVAALAGLGSGILSAVIVNATLPFLESVFGVLTATSLLDLADRNHPLLRELEQKALGSYNHSIEVSKHTPVSRRSLHSRRSTHQFCPPRHHNCATPAERQSTLRYVPRRHALAKRRPLDLQMVHRPLQIPGSR